MTATSAIRYHDFTVRLHPDRDGGFTALIQHAPAGGGSAAFRLPVAPEQLAAWREPVPAEGGVEAPRHVEVPLSGTSPVPSPREVGRTLYETLFAGRVRDSFLGSMGRTGGETGRGLRLRLVFDPSVPGVLPLAALPWELLYDPESRDFLARNPLTPVVRFLDVPRFTVPPAVEPPLRVLVVMASPKGSPPLNLPGERRRIEGAWRDPPSVKVEFLAPATLESTRARLRQGTFQVLHFVGHGDFDPATGEGILLFDDGAGEAAPVSGAVLAEHLKGIESLRLAVLNACRSSELPLREGVDPYSGVASALVLGGLLGVVAMQRPITDRAALAFADQLYAVLSEGRPVEAALAEGRLAIYRGDPDSFEWAVPALYLRSGEGRLLERVVEESPTPPAIREKVRDFSALIDERSRGFVGRGFVFEAVERFLDEADGGYFLLTGEPGIGKTALIAELVRRHGWVHHFNSRAAGIYRPEAFLENICAQLIETYGLEQVTLPEEAIRDSGFLLSLLQRVAHQLGRGEKAVLLVDALDETDDAGLPAGVNPLHLPPQLPGGIHAVVSSRPLRPEEGPTISGRIETLKIGRRSRANLADVRELVASHLGRPGIHDYLTAQGLTETRFLDWMVDKSAGNFMYLSYVLPAIEAGEYEGRELAELPDGLERYYGDHWKRMRGRDTGAWLERKLPVLGALTSIDEPVPLDLVARFAGGVERRWVREVLREWRPFLHLSEGRDESGRRQTLYSIYHQSFHDFLTGKDEVADEQRVISEAEREVLDGSKVREVKAMMDAFRSRCRRPDRE